VLQRGYARVTDTAGQTLTSSAQAGKQPALTLRFRDGSLDVVPKGGPGSAPRKRPAAATPPPTQPKLL
jgi:exodeoxyribonuclease VII large subunit